MSATAQTALPPVEVQDDLVTKAGARKWLAVGRIVIGFFFLWPFLDKTFGLGYATPSDRAWINGGNPAQGYLMGVTGEEGVSPFKGFFEIFINQHHGNISHRWVEGQLRQNPLHFGQPGKIKQDQMIFEFKC